MKRYIKNFWVLFLILIIFGLGVAGVAGYRSSHPKTGFVRGNKEAKTDERVFDYGELLSEDEEAALRSLIAQAEDECGCDIVLVTLNREIGGEWNGLRDWADDFYDENCFGYDAAHGDGCVLVDNWYSFGDYNGDTWLSTSGRVENKYSSDDIDELLDDVCGVVNSNPYEAYKLYINGVKKHMLSGSPQSLRIPWIIVVIIALVLSGLYFLIHLYTKQAKDTTTPLTYVTGGSPVEERHIDQFLTKTVHKRKIETSSGSGGGGGHHISSGGFSHGGGGHHH
ncbi:MAG: TPM domain-containing protein [Lachnospiraceae bacterium]|nr:TPM domain-containing protein [Lachnospiraceae bacterium]MCR5339388.1 TPM domain-containing protein [Lachnospiraceae bacterium]